MYTYKLASNAKATCGVSVNKDFILIGSSRKIVLKHVTSFGLYSRHPYAYTGLIFMIIAVVAVLLGLKERETVIYAVAALCAVIGIVLMCIPQNILCIHTSCDADRTYIRGAKAVLNALYRDIETQMVAGSVLAHTFER